MAKARAALNRLPARKRKFVEARVQGNNIRRSAYAAGISPAAAYDYNKEEEVQQAYRELMRKAMPQQRLVDLIKGGCNAKKPTLLSSEDGKVVVRERPDWQVRRPFIDMAAKHAGYYEEKNKNDVATQIVIAVNHIGQNAPNQRIAEIATKANRTIEPV